MIKVTAKNNLFCIFTLISLCILLLPTDAMSQVSRDNILEQVVNSYRDAAGRWGGALRDYASRLFVLLALIEISWTGMRMSLEGDNLKDFFATLVHRIMTLGFFWALLNYSSTWIGAIVQSLRQAADGANAAAGGKAGISPGAMFDLGVDTARSVIGQVSIFDINGSVSLALSAIVIISSFAIIGAELLVALCEMHITINAGVIMLGLGGSSWTSPYALNFVKHAFATGMKLFVMQLVIGIGGTFIRTWTQSFNSNDSASVLTMIAVSIVFLVLVKRIPQMASEMVGGGTGGIGASLIRTASNVASAGASVASSAATLGYTVSEAAKLASSQNGPISGEGAARTASNAVGMLGATGVNFAKAAGSEVADKVKKISPSGSFYMSPLGRMAAGMKDQRTANDAMKEGGTITPKDPKKIN